MVPDWYLMLSFIGDRAFLIDTELHYILLLDLGTVLVLQKIILFVACIVSVNLQIF